MQTPADVPIPYRIIALMRERNRLFSYPMELLEEEIRASGFRCTCCGMCCTSSMNNHIFLVERDVDEARAIDPECLEPAPDPEFCDQNGTFYVSGYALRKKNDNAGSCWFLEERRCRIYNRRFSICRMYPHMLRYASDSNGQVAWRQFARVNEHGEYNHTLPDDECRSLALEIKEYENAFLTQQISFLEVVHEYFAVRDLWHDTDMHHRRMQQVVKGEPVTMMVYHSGELEEVRITNNGDLPGFREDAISGSSGTLG